MATGLRAPNGLTTGPDDAIYVSDNPFSGKMLHTSFGAAAMSAVFEQRVGDVSQAAAVKLPLKPFDSGIMRARFGADGAVYVCGVKGWQSKAVRDGCIARVRYTGQPAPLAVAWRVEKDMMFVAFDIALQPAAAADSQNWSLEQWNYQWHSKYGSQDVSIADPKKVGRDTVDIAAIHVSADGKTLTFTIPGLRPSMQFLLKGNIQAAGGAALPVEVVGTIHVVPPLSPQPAPPSGASPKPSADLPAVRRATR